MDYRPPIQDDEFPDEPMMIPAGNDDGVMIVDRTSLLSAQSEVNRRGETPVEEWTFFEVVSLVAAVRISIDPSLSVSEGQEKSNDPVYLWLVAFDAVRAKEETFKLLRKTVEDIGRAQI